MTHRIPDLWDAEPGYLNTATYGLPPHQTLHDLREALDSWRGGRTRREHWEESVERARRSFARLVGADPATVAVGSQVSTLVGLVATALPDNARVLVPEIEFTSNVFPYLVHAGRGVEVVTVPVHDLLGSIDERITAVAYSVVQSATGEITDMAAVQEAARAHGVARSMTRELRNSERMPGVDRIWLPGEQSHEKRERYAQSGIPLAAGLLEQLNKLAGELGIDPLN